MIWTDKLTRLIRRISYPTIKTIFEDYVDEWIEKKSSEIAEEVARRAGKDIGESRSARHWEVNRLVKEAMEDFEDAIESEGYVVLAEGGLVTNEEKRFEIWELPAFLETVAKKVYIKAIKKLSDREWVEGTARRGEKPETESDYLFWEDVDIPERHLGISAPVVYEDEVRDYIEGLAQLAVKRATESEETTDDSDIYGDEEMTDDSDIYEDEETMDDFDTPRRKRIPSESDIYYGIVDAVREAIDELERELRYTIVSVLRGNRNTKRGICKIFDHNDFLSRLYRTAFRMALKLAGLTDEKYREFYESFSDNYFEDEFFA